MLKNWKHLQKLIIFWVTLINLITRIPFDYIPSKMSQAFTLTYQNQLNLSIFETSLNPESE